MQRLLIQSIVQKIANESKKAFPKYLPQYEKKKTSIKSTEHLVSIK